MKSTAQIKGHPIHPILVGFPITFFIATLVTDIYSIAKGSAHFWHAGSYLELAGVITGLIAATPGITTQQLCQEKRHTTWADKRVYDNNLCHCLCRQR